MTVVDPNKKIHMWSKKKIVKKCLRSIHSPYLGQYLWSKSVSCLAKNMLLILIKV